MPEPASTQADDRPPPALEQFRSSLARALGVPIDGWPALHRLSVERFPEFWSHFIDWSGVEVAGDITPACTTVDVEQATFFPNLRLSYAWNLLRPLGEGDGDWPAIIGVSENGDAVTITRGELRRRVASVANGLTSLGLKPGQPVAALVRNTPDTVITALACAAVGATWCSAAPDMGPELLLQRFSQLDPVLLVVYGEATYQGVSRSLTPQLQALRDGLPSVRHVIALDAASMHAEWSCPVTSLSSLEQSPPLPVWSLFPFNQPLCVLFSSGTTGVPKGIVHGAGGTLLEHLKEHRLHGDMGPGDVVLYQTTCGWMMWNWLVSALGTGAAIVCYDGSPMHPSAEHLWHIAGKAGVTAFGTNPTYLAACQDADISPVHLTNLSRLRAVLSTGSVLRASLFDWVTEHVGPVPVQSISGGTDIIGCFVLGNPLLPVYRGESQCISLGLDVRVMTPSGAVEQGTGELVCCRPFPSRPVGFIRDPDGSRFHEAYFSQNPGVWTHGDQVELTERGTARILGRSDGTLNVRGIRIGPSEIYGVVLEQPGVRQAIAVEQAAPREPGGSRLVLLLVMHQGASLDRPAILKLKKALATRLSPNHVPAVVVAVAELPETHSGKLSERAARDVLSGRVPSNLEALRNPRALALLREHPELLVQHGPDAN